MDADPEPSGRGRRHPFPGLRRAAAFPLRGTVAVVTGAASGIGRATAVAVAARGGHLALTDRDGDAAARADRRRRPGR